MGNDVQLVFREVADLTPAERERYFAERQVAAELRAEVEGLLRFDAPGSESLTASIAAAAEDLVRTESAPRAGERCGPYQLIRSLGQGGMGTVFLAQRTDGEVEQRVAIKFVRNIA